MKCRKTDMLIIGGGIAGLSAAKVFAEKGISFLLLEGANRLGGRINSVQHNGCTLELGAQWVSGCSPKNPIYQLACEILKLDGMIDQQNEQGSIMVRSANGSDITPVAMAELSRLSNCLNNVVKKAEITYKSGGPTEDLGISCGLQKNGWQSEDAMKRTLEWFRLDFEQGENPNEISLKHLAKECTHIDFGDQDFLVTDKRGMSSIVECMASTLDPESLVTSQLVKKIKHSDDGVEVETSTQKIKAAKVLVTASVGVLQSQLIRFQPELPEWKRNAIKDIKMTSYIKVYATWQKKWWDTKFFHKLLVPREEQSGIKWRLASLVTQDDCDPRSNMLCLTVTGNDAREVQTLSEDQISQAIQLALSNSFKDTEVPLPESVVVPRWNQDELFRGTYSFLKAGSFHNGLADLQRNVGRVFFAGEAYHSKYSGYMHAAYLSGQQTASQMIL